MDSLRNKKTQNKLKNLYLQKKNRTDSGCVCVQEVTDDDKDIWFSRCGHVVVGMLTSV